MSNYTLAAHKKYARKLFAYMVTRIFIPIYLFAIIVGIVTNETTSGRLSPEDYIVYLVTRDWLKMLGLLLLLLVVCVIWAGFIARRSIVQVSEDSKP